MALGGGLPFEEVLVERSSLFEFDTGYELRTCSAEDLVVLKLFAFRPTDLADAESVVMRQEKLDWAYIEETLAPLVQVKGDPGILATFEKLRRL